MNFPLNFWRELGLFYGNSLSRLRKELGKKAKAYKYLDLVAIGTVADIVPLVGETGF